MTPSRLIPLCRKGIVSNSTEKSCPSTERYYSTKGLFGTPTAQYHRETVFTHITVQKFTCQYSIFNSMSTFSGFPELGQSQCLCLSIHWAPHGCSYGLATPTAPPKLCFCNRANVFVQVMSSALRLISFLLIFDRFTICHKTEVVKNTLNPVWQAFKIPVRALCNGDYDR